MEALRHLKLSFVSWGILQPGQYIVIRFYVRERWVSFAMWKTEDLRKVGRSFLGKQT